MAHSVTLYAEDVVSPSVDVFYVAREDTYIVTSRHPRPLLFEVLVLVDEESGDLVLATSKGAACSFDPIPYVGPGESVRLTCEHHKLARLVGTNGELVGLDAALLSLRGVTGRAREYNLLESPSLVTNATSILFDEGLVPEGYVFVKSPPAVALSKVLEGQGLFHVSLNLSGGFLVVARSPNGSAWNLLVSGYCPPRQGECTICIGGSSSDFYTLGYHRRFRLVLWGFEGGVLLNGSSLEGPLITRGPMLLVLNGLADKVALYATAGAPRQGLGYEPYVLVGDVTGLGYVGLVFSTVDFGSEGDENSCNDCYGGGSVLADDYSARPFTIVFRDLPIRGSSASYVFVTLLLAFIDNSLTNVVDARNNEPVLQVGLYEEAGTAFLAGTTVYYYTIQRYESVFDARRGAYALVFSPLSAAIPVPDDGRTYYLALRLWDPYREDVGFGSTWGDLDLVLVIGKVGVLFGERRG